MTAEQKQFLSERYHKKRKFLLEYAESSLHNYNQLHTNTQAQFIAPVFFV